MADNGGGRSEGELIKDLLLTPPHTWRRRAGGQLKAWTNNAGGAPALLVQRRLRWFGHAARRPEGELIKHLLPTLLRAWRR